ncbi:centromere protein H [Engraulis encrasicolus]|uniref:centromere protein H n=1 Tax=Engraulis encrasicolus TaxID=184585 RepID=UPI002FD1EA24
MDEDGLSPNRSGALGVSLAAASIADKNAAVNLVRIKEAMSNQCFEMSVQANLVNTRLVDDCEDVSKYEESLENRRTEQFNKTMALNRMLVWRAITSKLTRDDEGSMEMKMLAQHSLSCFARIQKLQEESRELQDQITEVQKERHEMKVLIKKAMEEITELREARAGQGEVDKASLEKVDTVVQKHRKFLALSHNILRGIVCATKINWVDDPELADLMMGSESMTN